jgi:hypothetical protein
MVRITLLLIMALVITLPAQAKQKKTYRNEISQQEYREQQAENRKKYAFSPAERNMIRAYLLEQDRSKSQKKHKKLPPGLQKKVARGKALPPGWQKKIAPGQSLDYQVYRQGVSLPDILLQRLQPTHSDSEILQVEDKIMRINKAGRTILDVFDLIPTP